ncbi:MAG: hypothetical protein Q8Q10_03040 [bacterium]|nr:hypothetical protein [bacterium]
MKLTPGRTRELLAKSGAIIEGHFVGTNGKHLSVYIAKDRATRLTSVASELCEGIAESFASDDIDRVVAPAVGGIALSQWSAYHITLMRPDRPEVLALYAEQEEELVALSDGADLNIPLPSFDRENDRDGIILTKGQRLVIKKPSFVLKRGFDKDVCGRRVLVAEDTLTTGGSAARTVRAVISVGGIVVGVGVLANGGKVTAASIGVDRLEALMEVDRQMFTEAECADHGLCAQGVPINTDFGHGAAFLARKAAEKQAR